MTAGLQSGQWGRKKAAAAALTQICQTSGDALAPHLPAVLDALLKVGSKRHPPASCAVPNLCGMTMHLCGMHHAA